MVSEGNVTGGTDISLSRRSLRPLSLAEKRTHWCYEPKFSHVRCVGGKHRRRPDEHRRKPDEH